MLFCVAIAGVSSVSYAQSFDDSGIAAGFFDSSKEMNINFSEFHLPPLAVLFENAKSTPQVMSLQKAQEIAEAEVAKQKRHIFSYLTGHASYSYGVSDMWGQNSSSYYTLQMMQFQGSEQSYWNVGVNLAVPVEDILDLSASIKRKKLEVDQAIYNKDMQFEALIGHIAYLAFVSIASFIQPSYELTYAFKVFRMLFLLLTWLFEGWGLLAGMAVMLVVLVTTRTVVGGKYLYPLIPFNGKALLRLLYRQSISRFNAE